MKTWKAELLYQNKLFLGEGAIWHPQWKKFLYVDIEGCKVGCIDPVTKITEEKNVSKRIGTVVPSIDGNLILALQGSLEELNFETGERKKIIDLEIDKPENRSNDGKCDAAGRLWIGTMHTEAKLKEGALYSYDGKLKKMLNNISVSNGICWSNDNSVMYYIDSCDSNIKAYDFELETGNISNERTIVEIKEPHYTPDGMCIDEQGMLWVAIWSGACVNRYNPFDGTLIGKVTVDAPNVTACAFGGYNLQQLFITTARAGLGTEQLLQYPLSGSLFVADINIKGVPTNYFSSVYTYNQNKVYL
jgi:sugar lactone lactonase YvrE